MWLPDRKILFTGDLFGHIFPMWPNLTTIRGERARFPLPYVESLNRMLELDPVLLQLRVKRAVELKRLVQRRQS